MSRNREWGIALTIALAGSLLVVLLGYWQALVLPCTVAGFASKKFIRGVIVGFVGALASLAIVVGRMSFLSPIGLGHAAEAGLFLLGLPIAIGSGLGVLGGAIGALVYRARSS